jgi:hypothetical protein
MSIKVVQTINPGFGISASSLNMVFGANNTAGNAIFVQVRFASGSTPYTCTDSRGNIYATAYSNVFGATTQHFSSFYSLGIKGGANTITVSQGASNFIRAVAMEVSGIPPNATVEGPAAYVSGNSTVATTSALTTVGSSDYLVAFHGQILVNEPSTPTSSAPFTLEVTTVGGAFDATLADATLGPGTYSSTLTYPTGTIWGAGLIAFQLNTSSVPVKLSGVMW